MIGQLNDRSMIGQLNDRSMIGQLNDRTVHLDLFPTLYPIQDTKLKRNSVGDRLWWVDCGGRLSTLLIPHRQTSIQTETAQSCYSNTCCTAHKQNLLIKIKHQELNPSKLLWQHVLHC